MSSPPDIAKLPLILTNHIRPGARLLFGGFGLVPLLWPAWALHPWTIPFGGFAVAIWIIVLGAVALGLVIVGAMIFAPDVTLTIAEDKIVLERKSILGSNQRNLRTSDITNVSIKVTEWQDGPDTYAVQVSLASGRPFQSEPIPTKDAAELAVLDVHSAIAAFQRDV